MKEELLLVVADEKSRADTDNDAEVCHRRQTNPFSLNGRAIVALWPSYYIAGSPKVDKKIRRPKLRPLHRKFACMRFIVFLFSYTTLVDNILNSEYFSFKID